MSNLHIFKISVDGKHQSKFSECYYGVAPDLESAMSFASDVARNEGWFDFVFDSVIQIGDLSFLVAPPDDDSFIDELTKTNEKAIKPITGVIAES